MAKSTFGSYMKTVRTIERMAASPSRGSYRSSSRSKISKYLTNPLTNEQVWIEASNQQILQNKIEKQLNQWEKSNARLLEAKSKEELINKSKEDSRKALLLIEEYKNILLDTLSVSHKINWESIKDQSNFNKTFVHGTKPTYDEFIKKENLSPFNFIPSIRQKNLEKEEHAKQIYAEVIGKFNKVEQERLNEFEKDKENFLKSQARKNEIIEEVKTQYESNQKEGVNDYIKLVLRFSKYPKPLEFEHELEYEENGKVLVVEVDLPRMDMIPKETAYKYQKDDVKISYLNKKDFEELYNDVLIKISLRMIYEIFNSDYANAIDVIVFNGMVNGINPKTGIDFRNCVISIQVTKEELQKLNLLKVNPQECFRFLKGMTAGSLVNLAPVKPIMKINIEDRRIIASDAVIGEVDENTNLASMDWQKFEVLVRDLLQKEFGNEGSKVEVTQASRDNGVDAIAFDEDPIRGGKYVIQAKRYNHIVPVSAVRDLYGTVLNEGAVKGILITTAYFGKESLEFANNKPLKLINGEELMYMFNKHGYKVKIELKKRL